jgi:hypothetical protein
MNCRMAKTTVLLLMLALVGAARASTASGPTIDDFRKFVEELLPGAYLHSDPVLRARGACSVAPVKDRPGVYLFQGEPGTPPGYFRLDEKNPFHLIKIGGSHPESATILITRPIVNNNGDVIVPLKIEVLWVCPQNHSWIGPR